MNVFAKSTKLSKRRFQVQKIFVEKLRDERNVLALEGELAVYFCAFGTVIDVKVLRNDFGQLYGYITFSEEEMVFEALARRHSFKGAEITVDRALEKLVKAPLGKMPARAKKIFVGGVPNKATKEELAHLFGKYGAIEDVSLPHKSKDENKGYAFITFEELQAVERVFADLKNIVLRAKTLDVKNVNNEVLSGVSHERGADAAPAEAREEFAFSERDFEDTTASLQRHRSKNSLPTPNSSLPTSSKDITQEALRYQINSQMKKIWSGQRILPEPRDVRSLSSDKKSNN